MSWRRTPRRADGAMSDVLGVAVMIGLAVLMASILFFWVGVGGEEAVSPVAVTMTSDGKSGTRTAGLVVTSVSAVANWSDFRLELDGKRLSYDHTLSGPSKFCVARSDGSCIDELSWNPRALRVETGQTLYVHDDALAGKTLKMIHARSGATVVEHAIPERTPIK